MSPDDNAPETPEDVLVAPPSPEAGECPAPDESRPVITLREMCLAIPGMPLPDDKESATP